MRYRIVYERAAHNYGAYSPDLPGCIAAADTLDECRILMREAIAFHLEGSRRNGDRVPPDPTGFIEILDFEPEQPRRKRPTSRLAPRARKPVSRRKPAKRARA
jgi:predicted RNase H-like HicB family nuclease